MAGLEPPPADLRGFPRRTLRRTTDLYRAHDAELDPWWFQHDGEGRFDLRPPQGTCYVAMSRMGAFVEKFRDFTVIAYKDVAARRISLLRVKSDLLIADLTSPRAHRFDVTGHIHSSPNFAVTQQWAAALNREGFQGVQYLCSQDPSQREVAVALFGNAGHSDFPVQETLRIGQDILVEAERLFGINVQSTPPWRRP